MMPTVILTPRRARTASSVLLAALVLTLGCEKTVPLQLNLIEPVDQANQALNGIQTLRVEYRALDPSTGMPDANAENGDAKAFLVGSGDNAGLTFSLEDEVFITVKGFTGNFEENAAVLNQLPDAIGRSVPVRPSQGDIAQLEVTLPVGILDSFGQTTTRDAETGETSQTEMDNGVAVPGRHGHTATYLPTIGKVLIVGGAVWADANGASPDLPQCKDFDGVLKCFTILQSVELYDPATGAFETLTNSAGEPLLANSRAYHTATLLLDGRVLIMGGFSFFTVAGNPVLDTLVNGFIFDPDNIGADPVSDPLLLTARRAMHVAVPINDQGNLGQVAIIGGCHGTGCSTFGTVADPTAAVPDPVDRVPNVVELFDVESGSSTAVPFDDEFAARIARVGHQATRMGDFVIVSGGHDSDGTKCNIEILGVQSGTLVQPANYPDDTVRSLIDCPTGHTQVTIANNTVAIIGGLFEAPGGIPADTAAPSSLVQFWTTTGPSGTTVDMLSGRAFHQSVLLQNGSILNIGGRIPLGGTAAERLDQAVGGTFTASALALPLDESRTDMGVVAMPNNQVFVSGGYAPNAGVSTSRADIYFGD
jgi:hypothetical protein